MSSYNVRWRYRERLAKNLASGSFCEQPEPWSMGDFGDPDFTCVPVLLNKLNDMRKKEIGIDCTIVAKNPANDSLIRSSVHSMILLANESKYCEQILGKNGATKKDNDEIEIAIPHCTSENALKHFLEFLYTERFNASSITACEVITLSRTFELPLKVETKLLHQVHRQLKSEECCKKMIKLTRELKRDDYVAKTMESWIDIRAKSAKSSFRQLRPYGKLTLILKEPAWMPQWVSAIDLIRTSNDFCSVWNILDVLQWINIGGINIEFSHLLDTFLPNELVQESEVAQEHVANIVCLRAESNPDNITLKNYLQVKFLRKRYFAHDKFQQLQLTLCKFMAKHFEKVAKNSNFFEIETQELITILKSPDLKPPLRDKTFDAIAKWMTNRIADVETYPEVFILAIDVLFKSKGSETQYLWLLKKIEMEAFSPAILISVLEHRLMQNDQKAREFVSRIICSKFDSDGSKLTIDYCFTIKRLMKIYQFTEYSNLKKSICDLIINNLEKFLGKDEMCELECDEMVFILGSSDVAPTFEKEKVNMILKWVEYRKGREKSLPVLFSEVKIHSLPNQFIKTMSLNPLIAGKISLLHQVIGALCDHRCDSSALPHEIQPKQMRDGNSHSILQDKADGGHLVAASEQLHVEQHILPQNCLDCEIASTISDVPSHATESTAYSFPTASYESGRSSPYGSELGADLHGSDGSSGYNTCFNAAPPSN